MHKKILQICKFNICKTSAQEKVSGKIKLGWLTKTENISSKLYHLNNFQVNRIIISSIMSFSNCKQCLVKLTWEGESRTSVTFNCNNTQVYPLMYISVTFINYKFYKLEFEVLNMKQTTGYFFFHWGMSLQEIHYQKQPSRDVPSKRCSENMQ